MRVITLENIEKYIKDKHGEQCVSVVKPLENKEFRAVVIHDKGSECPALRVGEGTGLVSLDGNLKHVHCMLTETILHDLDKDHPFVGAREALGGLLMIDGRVPTEDELRPYMYKV